MCSYSALLSLAVGANAVAQGSNLDYCPSTSGVLNTNSTQIVPKNGAPITVSGGVFRFRNVTINQGVTVSGAGSNPMVWIVEGDFIVNGTLSVDGGEGQRVDTLSAANFPAAGGVGACGGGDGGRGSPETTAQSFTGERGFGAGQLPSHGGGGGHIAVRSQCGRGSGGGGGTFATAGDPYYKVKKDPNSQSFCQQTGVGGFGCVGFSGAPTRSLAGGAAGPAVFTDARDDNNFVGVAFNVQTGERIRGELRAVMGGQGGGGGGDLAGVLGVPSYISNSKGGGGGAGGGVLIIFAKGRIEVGPFGLISANGGNGGGGEQAGGNNEGGGGAGGSGGTVVMHSRQEIVLHTHGETYANDDYSFAISADGGVGTQGSFGGQSWDGKYPPPAAGERWDRNPSGAFGGLGLIQLAAPIGDNADGTNTVLDDGIRIMQGRIALVGQEKARYLGWRGYPNELGVWVDDGNVPTYNNDPSNPLVTSYPSYATSADDAGDIRPAPILFPAH